MHRPVKRLSPNVYPSYGSQETHKVSVSAARQRRGCAYCAPAASRCCSNSAVRVTGGVTHRELSERLHVGRRNYLTGLDYRQIQHTWQTQHSFFYFCRSLAVLIAHVRWPSVISGVESSIRISLLRAHCHPLDIHPATGTAVRAKPLGAPECTQGLWQIVIGKGSCTGRLVPHSSTRKAAHK